MSKWLFITKMEYFKWPMYRIHKIKKRGVFNMGYTMTFHNGSQCNRNHNIRDKKVVDKQKHIDKSGEFEIWKDEVHKDAYERLFGAAVKEYNENQREDRKIKNYYDKVSKQGGKHSPKPVYEVIISIGNMKECVDEDISKKILKEFIDDWSKRNPNLEMIGAYYHNDETGVPHCHLDYIPIAHKNVGLKVKNSLSGALQEQGFDDKGRKNTRQMQWEKSEKEALKEICQTYGIEIKDNTQEKREHLSKEQYIMTQQKKEMEDIYNKLKIKSYELRKTIEEQEKQLQELNQKGDQSLQALSRVRELNSKAFSKMNELMNTWQGFDKTGEAKELSNIFREGKEIEKSLEKSSKDLEL